MIQDWEKANDYDFDTSLEILKKIAIADYTAFMGNAAERSEGLDKEYYQGQINEYAEKFVINTRGSKYVKLINDRAVWGFVVKKDSDKFKRGDILMAAGWSAPALNKARGNIFEEYSVAWTGPMYL
tara:strand:+ start:1270 stop:1647 length:378 start_codon:yes stop_codon:yes gene_type:complete